MSSLTQLTYAVAVDRHRNFRRAAKACAVSQPTLSTQLLKLEDELGVTLFDRSRKPVVPTREGQALLTQFRAVLSAHDGIEDVLNALNNRIAGTYRLGIIPTMAPTVLPRVVPQFIAEHPLVDLRVEELTTAQIVARLMDETLDGGILATPLGTDELLEYPLCAEEFLIFHTPDAGLDVDADDRVQVADLPTEQLIVMREGHCLRTQTLDLCALGDAASVAHRFHIEAGSVATLCAMVRGGPFFTILPALAAQEMRQQGHGSLIKEIAGDVPFRQIALVARRAETRRAVREALFGAAQKALRPLTESTRVRQIAPLAPL